MTKQFAKRSLATILTTAAFALAAATPVRAADQSKDWFKQQRSLTEGASIDAQPSALSPAMAKGAESRVGQPAVSPEGEACSNQEPQLRDASFSSDGTAYTGAQDTALHLHGHRSAL